MFQDFNPGYLNLGVSAVLKQNERYFLLLHAEWMLKSLCNLMPN